MHVYVFMCVLTSVEARGEQHTFPSVILHLINFFLDSPFTEPGAHQSCYIVLPKPHRELPVSASLVLIV